MPYSKVIPIMDLLQIDFPDDVELLRNDINSFEAGINKDEWKAPETLSGNTLLAPAA